MPIDVGQRSIHIVKQLTNLEFNRNLRDNQFRVFVEYVEGYFEEGKFIALKSSTRTLTNEQAVFVLGLRGSQGNISDPTLAQMLTQIFDGIETGGVRLPEPAPMDEPPSR